MSHEQNITTVREIYDAVARGDVPAILDRLTGDVDWAAQAAGDAAPWHGHRAGRDAVASFFEDLARSIEILELVRTASPPAMTPCSCSCTGPSGRSPTAAKPR